MSLRQSAARFALLLGALVPLACAVEKLDFPDQSEEGGGSGGVGNSAGLPPITTAGKTNDGGTPSTGGTPSSGGKAGSTSSGGNVSGGGNTSNGGSGGSSAGNSSGGSSAGNSSGGSSGGSSSTGCAGLPEYKAGDSTQMFKVGDMLQWKGKKYECVQPVQFPNAGCEPDAPMDWCAGWFKAVGSC